MNRRTLNRALAVVVAIAAISPLFALESTGCAKGSNQNRPIQQTQPPQTQETLHH